MAAYLALGQFISTFAEPERSGFDIDENGMLVRCQKINLTTTVTSDRDSPLPSLEDPSLESDRLVTRFVILIFNVNIFYEEQDTPPSHHCDFYRFLIEFCNVSIYFFFM